MGVDFFASIRIFAKPLILKFWEKIRTTNSKKVTVVFVRQYCVYLCNSHKMKIEERNNSQDLIFD